MYLAPVSASFRPLGRLAAANALFATANRRSANMSLRRWFSLAYAANCQGSAAQIAHGRHQLFQLGGSKHEI